MDLICASARKRRMDPVKRRLNRLLRPSMAGYFAVLVLFCAAALYVGRYWLAAAEACKNFVVK